MKASSKLDQLRAMREAKASRKPIAYKWKTPSPVTLVTITPVTTPTPGRKALRQAKAWADAMVDGPAGHRSRDMAQKPVTKRVTVTNPVTFGGAPLSAVTSALCSGEICPTCGHRIPATAADRQRASRARRKGNA